MGSQEVPCQTLFPISDPLVRPIYHQDLATSPLISLGLFIFILSSQEIIWSFIAAKEHQKFFISEKWPKVFKIFFGSSYSWSV
jgi:hypothetical protein